MRITCCLCFLFLLFSCKKEDNSIPENKNSGATEKYISEYHFNNYFVVKYFYDNLRRISYGQLFAGGDLQEINVYQYSGNLVIHGDTYNEDSIHLYESYFNYSPDGTMNSYIYETFTMDSFFYDSSGRVEIVKHFDAQENLLSYKEVNYVNDTIIEFNFYFPDGLFAYQLTTYYDSKINPFYYTSNKVPTLEQWKHNKLFETSPQADSQGKIQVAHNSTILNVALRLNTIYEYVGDYPTKAIYIEGAANDSTLIEYFY